MSLIQVNDLTFGYDTSPDLIFQNASFQLDTDWKLGFIGRNGRGKTTFLRLLQGLYPYRGTITAAVEFSYFPFSPAQPQQQAGTLLRGMIAPFDDWERRMEQLLAQDSPAALEEYAALLDQYLAHDGYTMDELLTAEVSKLGVPPEVLLQPWNTLSGGEQVKLMLAALFLKRNNFLLIDEPTNHLDLEGRRMVAQYLKGKKGFILVSHDRSFLDDIVDHVLSINRSTIQVQRGNYTTWQQNKDQQDHLEKEQNQKLKKEINRLQQSARRTAGWSETIEARKFGTGGVDRGFLGHKSAKMMARAKAIEVRQQRAIQEKSALMKDLELSAPLKLQLLLHPKKCLIEARDLSLHFCGRQICTGLSFTVEAGERVLLSGHNGCGKTSLLRLLQGEPVPHTGQVTVASGLVLSTIAQDTALLQGSFSQYCEQQQIDRSLLFTILRKLDLGRAQFEKDLSQLSGGQKKKVLIASSLCRPAHLYLWDEPLNFIDLLSRSQIEEVILREKPTLLFVEHDRSFQQRIATKEIGMG